MYAIFNKFEDKRITSWNINLKEVEQLKTILEQYFGTLWDDFKNEYEIKTQAQRFAEEGI